MKTRRERNADTIELFISVPFFFSSRRRHTRCSRDWSSDVCSSDLSGAPLRRWVTSLVVAVDRPLGEVGRIARVLDRHRVDRLDEAGREQQVAALAAIRSEERRVGKAWWIR